MYVRQSAGNPVLEALTLLVFGKGASGALLFLCFTASAAVLYVDANSPGPSPPYDDWSIAATVIQDAVDAAAPGDLVLVTNGTYQTGGSPGIRVDVRKPITLQSVNGPGVTVTQGQQNNYPGDTNLHCVYLVDGATVAGFTLNQGGIRQPPPGYPTTSEGGSVWCQSVNSVVSNCFLFGNRALNGGAAYRGTLVNCVVSNNGSGGVYRSVLKNCLVVENGGSTWGGAAYCTLINCTVSHNTGFAQASGAYYCAATNSVLYFNQGFSGVSNYYAGTLDHCCTWPLPASGVGNFSNDPMFVSYSADVNLHLRSNSPCINAGRNSYVPAAPDLDGNPRIAGGTVDVGAFEFQAPASVISYAWLQQYHLAIDGTADYADPDGEGMNNWQEWICGTIPTNALSVLRLSSLAADPLGIAVTWQSVSNRSYFLERATDLGSQQPFAPVATGIIGQPVSVTYFDTNAIGPGPFFYRVGVEQ